MQHIASGRKLFPTDVDGGDLSSGSSTHEVRPYETAVRLISFAATPCILHKADDRPGGRAANRKEYLWSRGRRAFSRESRARARARRSDNSISRH